RWEKAKLERRFDALRVDPAQVEVREDLLAAMFDGDRTRFDQIADVVAECAEASAKTRGRSERDLRIEGHGAFRVERAAFEVGHEHIGKLPFLLQPGQPFFDVDRAEDRVADRRIREVEVELT